MSCNMVTIQSKSGFVVLGGSDYKELAIIDLAREVARLGEENERLRAWQEQHGHNHCEVIRKGDTILLNVCTEEPLPKTIDAVLCGGGDACPIPEPEKAAAKKDAVYIDRKAILSLCDVAGALHPMEGFVSPEEVCDIIGGKIQGLEAHNKHYRMALDHYDKARMRTAKAAERPTTCWERLENDIGQEW